MTNINFQVPNNLTSNLGNEYSRLIKTNVPDMNVITKAVEPANSNEKLGDEQDFILSEGIEANILQSIQSTVVTPDGETHTKESERVNGMTNKITYDPPITIHSFRENSL